jgi:hypothetical protein
MKKRQKQKVSRKTDGREKTTKISKFSRNFVLRKFSFTRKYENENFRFNPNSYMKNMEGANLKNKESRGREEEMTRKKGK